MIKTYRTLLIAVLMIAFVSACQPGGAQLMSTNTVAATLPPTASSSATPASSPTPQGGLPDQVTTAKLVQKLVEEEQRGTAIVIGFISADPPQRWIVAYGKLSETDARAPDGDTVYEIGSISKTFTGMLLAESVLRGEMKLEDPISFYLPEGQRAPTFDGKEITLLDLVTHTSGLPRMPTNFAPADLDNPYADYTLDMMFDFLSGFKLTRVPGSAYEYSNYGAVLEGYAILQATQVKDYESLLVERITNPLGMLNTRVQLTPVMRQHLAQGHNSVLYPVKNWDLGILAPAGGIRSTANDMLTYLAANLGILPSDLLTAMQLARQPRRPADMGAGEQVGLNWFIRPTPKGEIIFHGGATGGYTAFVGFNPELKIGVVVLNNAYLGGTDIQDVGFHLLDPSIPLMPHKPRVLPTPIKVDTKILETYVGEYLVDERTHIIITLDAGQLYCQIGNQNNLKLTMLAISPSDFALREDDVIISFTSDIHGKVYQILWTENGANTIFNRTK